jgi:hypothetical protein
LRDCRTSKREEKLGKKSKWKDSRKKKRDWRSLFIDKYKIDVMLGQEGGGGGGGGRGGGGRGGGGGRRRRR